MRSRCIPAWAPMRHLEAVAAVPVRAAAALVAQETKRQGLLSRGTARTQARHRAREAVANASAGTCDAIVGLEVGPGMVPGMPAAVVASLVGLANQRHSDESAADLFPLLRGLH